LETLWLRQGEIDSIFCRHDLVPAHAAKIFVADDSLLKRGVPYGVIQPAAAHADILGHADSLIICNRSYITFQLPCLSNRRFAATDFYT
jgi:hypothetical protein